MMHLDNSISEHLLNAYNDAIAIISKFNTPQLFLVKLYYVLSEIDPKYADQYRKASLNEGFWEEEQLEFYGCSDELFYLIKLGLPDNDAVDKVINSYLLDIQNRHGYIPNNHAQGLRALFSYDEKSNHTLAALKYLLEWIEKGEFKKSTYEMGEIPYAMLALMELDYEKYKPIISNMSDILIEKQAVDGSIRVGFTDLSGSKWSVRSTSDCILALCRHLGSNNQHVLSAIDYVTKGRPETGWELSEIADVMLALLESGHGNKIPVSQVQWQIELLTRV